MINKELEIVDRVKVTSQTWGYRRRHHIGIIVMFEQYETICPYKVTFDIADEYNQYYMWFSNEDLELII